MIYFQGKKLYKETAGVIADTDEQKSEYSYHENQFHFLGKPVRGL
jgi:hypothetical protein